jgi:hypothetical protein
MKVKIRGISTTALTKLFIDNVSGIVHPSPAIKKRFGVSDNLVLIIAKKDFGWWNFVKKGVVH